jgi:hypothetical protein
MIDNGEYDARIERGSALYQQGRRAMSANDLGAATRLLKQSAKLALTSRLSNCSETAFLRVVKLRRTQFRFAKRSKSETDLTALCIYPEEP